MQTPSRLSRRELLALAGGVTVTAWQPWPAAAADASLPLITRPIPVSGERLPAIGLGTDAFDGAARDDIRAELAQLPALGGSVIDTAAAYGDSEALIGAALAALGTRSKTFLATKLVAADGPASFARSLERLQTRSLDLLQVHNLNGMETLVPLLQRWKTGGQIRYFGATTSRLAQHEELLAAMRRYPLDFIQVDYSLANREAAEHVLPLAQERRIAVLINLPFGRSSLFRQAASRQLPAWAAELDIASWAQYFLKYVIGHPAVTCAIPGSTKLAHLIDNQAAGRGRLPDATQRRRMEEYWDGGG
jgi:aryl-alcohol dehydrogenase-like predicted oxidoreductase